MNARLTPAAATNPELDAFWMPFTANRQFKANPRLLARAKGMYYTTADGREVLDGVAGLWCVNAGHGRREITEAVTQQLETMEFAPTFQMGHPIAFELANRLAKIAPPGLDRIFFTNSGSESVDTALKIAIAYHRARGAAQRTRLIRSEPAGEDCAARPGPNLLYQLGFGIRGYRAENCHCLPPGARGGAAHAADRPREGLSRCGLWRDVGRRHGQQPQVFRLIHVARRGSSVTYAGPRTQCLLARHPAVGHAP